MNRHPIAASLLVLALVFASSVAAPGLAYADKNPYCKNPKDCEGVRPVCFNVFCQYQVKDGDKDSHQYHTCSAGSVFYKNVTTSGKEVEDNSWDGSSPDFEVECDTQRIFNGSAHRYTDYLGTRLQAVIGPFPAVTLPRGALADGHRYVLSNLEFGTESLRGSCYIYTGPQ